MVGFMDMLKGTNAHVTKGGSNTGTVEPYDGAQTGSEFQGGRRRRKTARKGRKVRKGSTKRRRSRKQRLYGGNSQQQQQQQEQQEQHNQQKEEEEEEDEHDASGGARRRKGRRGKKTRGKVSGWITHVLKFAKDNKMKYFQALKDKRCRATYKANK